MADLAGLFVWTLSWLWQFWSYVPSSSYELYQSSVTDHLSYHMLSFWIQASIKKRKTREKTEFCLQTKLKLHFFTPICQINNYVFIPNSSIYFIPHWIHNKRQRFYLCIKLKTHLRNIPTSTIGGHVLKRHSFVSSKYWCLKTKQYWLKLPGIFALDRMSIKQVKSNSLCQQ